MVRAYHPQRLPNSLTTNTNYPPQNADESGVTPPQGGLMQYEDFVTMEYEDGILMEYSGGSITGLEGIGGTTDNIIWDDGVDTGNLEYVEA